MLTMIFSFLLQNAFMPSEVVEKTGYQDEWIKAPKKRVIDMPLSLEVFHTFEIG